MALTLDELFTSVQEGIQSTGPESALATLHMPDCRYRVSKDHPLDPEPNSEPVYEVVAIAVDSSRAVIATARYFILACEPSCAVLKAPVWTTTRVVPDISALTPDQRGDGLMVLGQDQDMHVRAAHYVWQPGGWQPQDALTAPSQAQGSFLPLFLPIEDIAREAAPYAPPGSTPEEQRRHIKRAGLMYHQQEMLPQQSRAERRRQQFGR